MNKKLTNNQIDEMLISFKIKRIDNYINNHTKIKFQCLIENCNNIWYSTTNQIFSAKVGCPKCSGFKLNNSIIDERLKNLNIKRIEQYISARLKIKFQCLICNHIWKTQPSHILNDKSGCPNCALNNRKPHTQATKEKIKYGVLAHRANNRFILPTTPERAVHSELYKYNIQFTTETLINNRFCVDIYIPIYNLIIYVDGCYWHACPSHFPMANKPKSDMTRLPYLTKCGYNIEIIWEHDINNNCETIIKAILEKYKSITLESIQ